MSSSLHLLKTRRFLPLFITQFFGAFNDNAFKNAFLIWFTYDASIKQGLNAQMMVALAAGIFILPFFLFSATAGQVADKYEKSKLTQIIKLIEIGLMVLCAMCFYLKNISGLLVMLFAMGAQSTFFGPIKYSLLPEHLKDNELIGGNGLIEIGTFLSILLGTIFGGLIIRTEYGVEFLSFFLIIFSAIGWFSSRAIPTSPVGDANLKIGWNIASETCKIISLAREQHSVWLSIIGISWFWFVGATFLTQLPIYTKEIIGGNEHIVTLFLTIFSIGIGIGSVWCNRLLNGEINGKLVPFASLGITITISLFVAFSYLYNWEILHYLEGAPHYKNTMLGLLAFFNVGISSWLILASLLSFSIISGIYIVPLYAIVQHRSNEHYLARIIAANNILNSLFMVGASFLAFLLFFLKLSVIDILMFVGILNILVFFIIRKIVKRRLYNV